MNSTKTILYVMGVTPEKAGGIELFCGTLARRLLPLGWRVVFCFAGAPSQPVQELLNTSHAEWLVLGSQAGLSPMRAVECARLIWRYRPDAFVYAFNGVLSLYPWAARLSGVRRIFYNDHSSRTLPPKGLGFLKSRIGRLLTLPLTGTICVSDYVRRCELAEGFVAPEVVSVIYNGVDLGRVAAAEGSGKGFREKHGIPEDRKIVLQVSWMVPVKGVDKLLQAARIVVGARPDTHFVLAGEGPSRAEYIALSEALGIAQHVTWTGMVASPISEGVFDASTACCLFSQWQEACPLTVIEAMSFGVPMVVSNTGALPDLVTDGESGYVVDKDDVPALADRIQRLLGDPELRARQGDQARHRVQQRFSLATTVDQYVQRITGIQLDSGLAGQ